MIHIITHSLLRLALGVQCALCGNAAHAPVFCAACRRDIGAARAVARCPRCAQRLAHASAPCYDCLAAAPAFDRGIVAFDYQPPHILLVSRLKNALRMDAAHALAVLLDDALNEAEADPLDMLVPIPASRTALRRRGFNPAGEIARALGKMRGLPVGRAWLARTRDGVKQSELGRRARLRETVGLYAARRTMPGLRIGLVDDVMTTGSTLDAAARALRDAGAQRVVALAAARAGCQAQ